MVYRKSSGRINHKMTLMDNIASGYKREDDQYA